MSKLTVNISLDSEKLMDDIETIGTALSKMSGIGYEVGINNSTVDIHCGDYFFPLSIMDYIKIKK